MNSFQPRSYLLSRTLPAEGDEHSRVPRTRLRRREPLIARLCCTGVETTYTWSPLHPFLPLPPCWWTCDRIGRLPSLVRNRAAEDLPSLPLSGSPASRGA